MPHIEPGYVAVALPLAWTVALGMEGLRALAGCYSGLLWYAALIKFWERTTIYSLAIAAYLAYAASGAVDDVMRYAAREYTRGVTDVIAPGLTLFIFGGFAALVALGIADIAAMLAWAITRRRMPWHYFAYASLWAEYAAYRALDWITDTAEKVVSNYRRRISN